LVYTLDNIDDIFRAIKTKIINLASYWERFRLTLPGRIIIAKTFLISQLNYIGCFLKPSDIIMEEIQVIIDNFVKKNLNIAGKGPTTDQLAVPRKSRMLRRCATSSASSGSARMIRWPTAAQVAAATSKKRSRGARGTTRDVAAGLRKEVVAASNGTEDVAAHGADVGTAGVEAGEAGAADAATFRSGEGGSSHSSILY
jgi:hypothetical protein